MGFDPDYFVSSNGETRDVDDCLLCPVCQSVYDTPMILDPCGHSFCKECVATLLNSGHENCPICRTKMIEGENVGVPPNRALKELISNMKIRCMNCPTENIIDKSDGRNNKNCCSWTGKLSEFQNHSEMDCPMHVVSCPIEGCNFEGPRWSMNQHNIDSMALHTDLLVASKLEKIKEELLGVSKRISNPGSNNDNSNGQSRLDEFQEELQRKDKEISTLRARLLDNWLSDFFREWLLAKPPYFQNFVVYRPIKYLTGPISQIIVGIPGPGNSDWEGGLYPLLITFTSEGFERKEPPKCDFPRNFFHPNVYEGNVHVSTLAEFEGSWDPSISLPEILFCIQQLLTHPNHRGLYDPEEYRDSVLLQAEKYSFSNGSDFLEKAMVGLQSKIDPGYKMPLQPWENVRWENLEEVRWKGIRPFQSRQNLTFARPYQSINQDLQGELAEIEISNNLSSPDSEFDEGENNDENNENNDNNEIEAIDSPNSRSILAPIANANSSELSPMRRMMTTGRLRDADGNICECSCCEQGSRHFLDREHKMRYFFGEGT
eukprot:CAMPEP_0116148976 /NCGR_PEP_ID=MMETSP0329-20121206/18674_1 /TAXON_ID=697910 /ORGANISM="Pseudo-nitzschia arenysensis, Strain B593" /LENGTH=544 /DNA_ID=CAMNT_0003645205 /DNA_START=46 /DNA_END=1680 /DNA_ORIENTATION=-